MRKLSFFIAVSMCLLLTACSSEKYSVHEKEIVIEVKTYTTEKEKEKDGIKFFEPLSYLLLNDKELTDEQKERIVVSSDVDFDKIGEYEISFKKDDKGLLDPIKVKVVDTTKAKISLTESEFQVGTDITEKIEFSDNYDDAETLKENLKVEGYDSEKEGEQEITISLKDSSGNETVEKFTITLTEAPKEEDAPSAVGAGYNSGVDNGIGQNDGNNGSMGNAGNNNGSGSSGGNSGSSGGGWTPPVEVPVAPPEPEYACPNGNNVYMSCDYIFAGSIGNGGLYDSSVAAEEALRKLGLTAQSNPISSVHYNDGRIKYTFNY